MELDWRPFELHPDTPEGGMPLSDYFPEPRLSAMRAHLERFAQSFGITDMKQNPRLSNTRRALAIAEYARSEGKLTAFRHAAMDSYWREGRALDSDEDLAYAASKAGLDPALALAAASDPVFVSTVKSFLAQGRERGVTGIPTFFIGPYRVVGCQPYETLAQVAEHLGAARRGS